MESVEINVVIQALDKAGIRYDLTGECTKIFWVGDTPIGEDTFYGIDLGIQVKPGVWAWWLVRGLENGRANEYWFRQRYNANVGKVLKSWKTGIKMSELVYNLIGVKLGC